MARGERPLRRRMEPITLHYSESLTRDIVRAQWWRATGALYFASWLASAGIYGYLLWLDERSWFTTVLAVGVSSRRNLSCLALL